MFSKKLSVVTVILNNKAGLLDTFNSIRNQKRKLELEYLIIDGLSSDGSFEFIEKNHDEIDVVISEKDRGIYDAMNKGIKQASGEWIYFLNAGDVFYDEHSISRILDAMEDVDILYSDVIVNKGSSVYTFKTSFEDKVLNHQGFVYRRELHQKFGPYAVIKRFTAADYLFFLQLNNLKVKKLADPIAIFQAGGLSSTVNAVRQKYCLDFLAGKISAVNLALRLIIYPVYRAIRKLTK